MNETYGYLRRDRRQRPRRDRRGCIPLGRVMPRFVSTWTLPADFLRDSLAFISSIWKGKTHEQPNRIPRLGDQG